MRTCQNWMPFSPAIPTCLTGTARMGHAWPSPDTRGQAGLRSLRPLWSRKVASWCCPAQSILRNWARHRRTGSASGSDGRGWTKGWRRWKPLSCRTATRAEFGAEFCRTVICTDRPPAFPSVSDNGLLNLGLLLTFGQLPQDYRKLVTIFAGCLCMLYSITGSSRVF